MNYRFILCWLCVCFLAPGMSARAASKDEIDAKVKEAIENFYKHTGAGKELAGKAAGMLVFPNVIKAGVGVGGEYGEGALLVKGSSVAYYSTASASIGFQLGAQVKSQIVLFMTAKALEQFRASKGWQAASMAASRSPHWVRAGKSTPKPPGSRSSASSFRTRG